MPEKVAIMTDDPQEIKDEIEKVNELIGISLSLDEAVQYIDTLRKKYHNKSNPDLKL